MQSEISDINHEESHSGDNGRGAYSLLLNPQGLKWMFALELGAEMKVVEVVVLMVHFFWWCVGLQMELNMNTKMLKPKYGSLIIVAIKGKNAI